ncbi:MAG: hypothetical protein CM1200mP30_03200 [Pseudomonadota bacterium]|nr:MAG: hypothetical protein CM1200mP30_03200 [Pseudomonadota bacterium]
MKLDGENGTYQLGHSMSEITAKLQDIAKTWTGCPYDPGFGSSNNETLYACASLRHSGGVTILTTRLEFATPPLWPGC